MYQARCTLDSLYIQYFLTCLGAGVQWLAYSPSGTVEGEVVYCHYGSPADFELLKQRGISVKGKIALMRYYRDWRGGKVRNAAENGAVGAILYSDPMEVAKDGVDSGYNIL